MRYFKYNVQEHDHPVVITDEQIMRDYYPYYREQMKKAGKEDLVSNEDCIENWLIVHWGWEVKEDEI